MKISLEALQILDAIDRRGSFAGAAKLLFKVPSTISYTVARLEEDLRVRLFERSGPKAWPTAAGRELLREGRQLLQAAQELEQRVHRVASGWEGELGIAIDSVFPAWLLEPDIRAFCEAAPNTRLRLQCEALSGAWEALLDRRVDLVIAAGEGPSGAGYVAEPLGKIDFVFAVAPEHPLAALDKVASGDLAAHRAIAVRDTARRLLPRTVGLLSERDVLTVATMHDKYLFQLLGLGYGFLPRAYAQAAIEQRRLVQVQVEERKPEETFYLAWRVEEEGKALAWWRERLRREGVLEQWQQRIGAAYRLGAGVDAA